VSNNLSPAPLHDNANLDATALDPLVLLPLGLLVSHLLLRLVVLLLLLLPTTIVHLLLSRIPARHRVRRGMMRLPILRMLRLMLLAVIERRHLRRTMPAAALSQINVNPPLVLLRVELQPQLPAHSFHPRLDLLHMPGTVVALANDDVQMRLPRLLGVADALLEDLLGLLDELAVQVDGVGVDAADGVVFAENVLGRLFVVVVCFGGVGFGLVRQVFGGGAVAALVGLLGARGQRLVLRLFVAG